MTFSERDRLLVLAPHPDDETLGAGGLLQRAAERGVPTRVVFATDGDYNPWPQRVAERRLWLGADGRARWGSRRRGEGYAALDALGLGRECAVFLGFPDRGLTRLLLDESAAPARSLVAQIAAWRPTVLVMPSLRDRHPDHNALALLALEAIATFTPDERPVVLTYVVHPFDAPLFRSALGLHLTSSERARKRRAIECHAAQLFFRRNVYRSHDGLERFATLSAPVNDHAPAHVTDVSREHTTLRIKLAGWQWRLRPAELLIVGWDEEMRHMAFHVYLLPGRSRIVVRARAAGGVVGRGRRIVRGRTTKIIIDVRRVATAARFFVKLGTPSGFFFDRDGWIEGGVRGREAEGRALAPHVSEHAGCEAVRLPL